ncbi:acyl-CoA carboxylase subunit beta, partial [Sphingomonas sp.]|uniref:acyl-CoA carboxylase subunit beta n=1 Tax=Sphingomonas sp. TaxID=28214 RepID=UPI002CE5212C
IAGYPAALLVASHYSVMVRENSHMFMGGPPVVARLGEVVTKEELGGADLQARAGAIDDVVDSEEEAFERARRFLSYLPDSVHEVAPRTTPTDDPNRRDPWLIEAIPRDRRKVYDVRRILRSLVDEGSLFEMGRAYGGAVVTALARLDGWPVAVMASDPRIYGGGWNAATSQKVTRFVDMATAFHLPVVNLVDIPGFVIGREAEMAGTIRHGCRAMASVYQSDAPWCTILMRKSFGVAGSAHTNHSRVQYRYAWPSGDWGSMPLEGGIEAAYRAEIASADDPAAKLAEIEARLNKLRSPLRTAEAFMVEDIIDPRETRPILCAFANTVAKLRTPGASSFGLRP